MSPNVNNANPSIDPALVAEIVQRVIARLREGGSDATAVSRAGGETPVRAQARADRAEASAERAEPVSGRAETVTERVVSAAVIQRVAGKTKRLNIHPQAVVTPAARDEARHHGITLVRGLDELASGPVEATQCRSGAARASGRGGRFSATAPGNPVASSAQTTSSAQGGSGSSGDPPRAISDPERPERAESVAAQLARRGVTGEARIVLSDRPAAEVQRRAAAGERAAMIRAIGDVERFDAELQPQVWVLDMVDLNWIAAVNVAARILRTGGAASRTGGAAR